MRRVGIAVTVVLVALATAGCDPASPAQTSSTAIPGTPSTSPTSDLPTLEQAEALAKIDLSTAASAINMFTFNYEDRLPVVTIEDGLLRVNSQTFEQKAPGESLAAWGGDLTMCVEYVAPMTTTDGDTDVTVHFDYGGAATAESGPCPASARALEPMTFPDHVELGAYSPYDFAPIEGTCVREEQRVLVGRVDKQDATVVVDCGEAGDLRVVNGGRLTEDEYAAGLDEELANQLCTISWDAAIADGADETWWVFPSDTGWSAHQRDFYCLVTQ